MTVVLAGISIALFSDEKSDRKPSVRLWLARTCGWLVGSVGMVKLAASFSGPDLGLDRWLFAFMPAAGIEMLSSLEPNTAFNFLLLGLSLVFLHSQERRSSVWAWVCALICGFESLLVIPAYAHGTGSFDGMVSFIPLALPNALAFLLVTFAILSCPAPRGFLAFIMRRGAGGALARTLLPAAVLVPMVLGWLRLEGQRRGLYDGELGDSLYVGAKILVFGSIIAWHALAVFRAGAKRRKAESHLRCGLAKIEGRSPLCTKQPVRAHASPQKATGKLDEREREDTFREQTARLIETEARLHAIVDNASSIVLVKDLDGKIVLVNQRFAALVGRTKEELIGHTAYDFFPKGVSDNLRAHDLVALRSGAAIEVEETVTGCDGPHTFIANKFPLRDPTGNIYALCDISTDITERKRMQDALLENKRALEAAVHTNQLIMDNSRDVICTIDENGRFMTVSAACESLWGYKSEELKGRQYIDLVYPEDVAKTNHAATEIIEGVAVNDFENRYVRKDGSLVDVTWSAYWSPSDRIMFAVAHDSTERARTKKALMEAKEGADRANRAKSEFLSRMSHELRTPMNAILGFAQLLEMDELTREQREGVGHIILGGRHLLELINEVLDLSRIEAGRMSLSREPVDISEALRETIEFVRPLAVERNVRLLAPERCDYYLLADRQRLKQVLLNLISNSIKYNRSNGSVAVTSRVRGDRVRVSVKDTGIGIPPERLEQLFTPFERLGAEQSAIEGTGLGLAVAKRLVEAMEGAIGVQSIVEEGTTFWVEFPLAESPLAQAKLADEPLDPSAAHSGDKRRVLYIEDNVSNLPLIERVLLRRPAVQLLTARDASEGLELARQHRPDLILLDLNLPDIHGHEVLERLQNDPRTSTISVVIISADATSGQRDKLIRAGAADYLTKPLHIKKFLQVLDQALSGITPLEADPNLTVSA